MAIEMELSAPAFLIAVPQMGDPNFLRSVVFILEHGEQGSMALMLNRTSTLAMGEFCASQKMTYKGDEAEPVFQGGPVQTDRAFLLHAQSEEEGPETEIVMNGIHLSYSLESLKILMESPPEHLRVFLGYAGWGPNQLADEISAGAWLVGTPTAQLVFNTPPEKMWERALLDLGIQPVQLMHSGSVH